MPNKRGLLFSILYFVVIPLLAFVGLGFFMAGTVTVRNDSASPVSNIRIELRGGDKILTSEAVGDQSPHSTETYRLPVFGDSVMWVVFEHEGRPFTVNCGYYGALLDKFELSVPLPIEGKQCGSPTSSR